MTKDLFSLRAIVPVLTLLAAGAANAQQDSANAAQNLYPPNAKPGECYAKVLVPAQYDTVTEKVLKREASEKISVAPAQFEWVEERVMSREGTDEFKVIPAEYKWVEEKVMVEPAATRLVVVPAEFETVSERVLDRPEQTTWKRGRGPIERVDHITGEILCLVVEPATYKTIERSVVKTPASTKAVEVPPVFKTVRKQVVETPARVEKVVVEPEYSVVKVRKMLEPARETRVSVPAEYQTVTKRVKVSSESLRWRPILCETNVTRDVIASLQQALSSAGHDPGDIDGVLGIDTLQAVESYQLENNLARGGLTMETLEKLEVKLH